MQAGLQAGGARYRVAMLTLTYRPDAAWEARDVTACLRRIREWLRRRGHVLRAVWVREYHESGRPHYHVLVWLPRGLTLPKPDKQGWWRKGSTRIEWARRPAAYMAKYVSKTGPAAAREDAGSRTLGVLRCPRRVDWYRSPGWVRQIARETDRIYRLPGGWIAVERLAHAWRSPWVVLSIHDWGISVAWHGWGPGDVRSLYDLGA